MKTLFILFYLLLFFGSSVSLAHQPVMDMAPRWEGGFGFQIRNVFYGSDELLEGDDEIDNPLDLERYVNQTWFEGVYTFDRSKRVTFKLPYVYQRRVKDLDGVGVEQEEDGIGDLIIGVPLKYYRNDGAFTHNFGFTPSIRIPTGSSSGDFPISDGSWDVGLSFSHSWETPRFYNLIDLFYWINTEGDDGMEAGDELGLDINFGIHPYFNNALSLGVYLMWDLSARYNQEPSSENLTTFTGGKLVQTGPILVLYKDTIMFRTELLFPVYEDVDGISNSRGLEISVGLGMTF